jgi:lycopene cyclase domain-containing protein
MLGSLAYPLLRSFEHRINFFNKWKFLFPGILLSAGFFIVWDIWFTRIGIWQFNKEFVLGYFLFSLPIEEWLFFLVIPFCCVFVYEVVNYFVKKSPSKEFSKIITIFLIIILLLVAVIYYQRLYTFVTFLLLSIFLLLHQFIVKSTYLGKFYLAWLVCLIPFSIVNGVLTSMPVLIYNNAENLGIRLGTIPIEDIFYGMLNVLQVVTVYEYLKQKQHST